MQNSERKTISLEEIEDIVRSVIKNEDDLRLIPRGVIMSPKMEEYFFKCLREEIRNYGSKETEETNTKVKDSQGILLRT